MGPAYHKGVPLLGVTGSPLIEETSLGCIHVLLTYFLDQDQRVHYFDIEMIIL